MKTFAIPVLLVIAVSFLLPVAASAQLTPYWGPILSCTGNYNQDPVAPVTEYCTSFCDLVKTVNNATRLGMTLAVYIIAPIAFVIGGFMLATAGGNPGRISSGRQLLSGTAIGLVLVLGSYLIVGTILWAMGNTQGYIDPATGKPAYVSWPNIQCNPANLPGGQLDPVGYKTCATCAANQDCKQVSNVWTCVTRPTTPPPSSP